MLSDFSPIDILCRLPTTHISFSLAVIGITVICSLLSDCNLRRSGGSVVIDLNLGDLDHVLTVNNWMSI